MISRIQNAIAMTKKAGFRVSQCIVSHEARETEEALLDSSTPWMTEPWMM
jgi:hypothetical protein